ncbi:MAG: hypothetical protein N4A47_05965 [Clostridia bacterium]|jgi:membrane protein implicated in regulation of membrane protease activity|nr:hypothetical protein [Clostridia bacterium]
MKYIVPIIVTAIFLLIFGLQMIAVLLSMFEVSGLGFTTQIIIGTILLFIALIVYALVYNLNERIKEIKEENEDDFKKY